MLYTCGVQNENFLNNFTFRKHLDCKNGNVALF